MGGGVPACGEGRGRRTDRCRSGAEDAEIVPERGEREGQPGPRCGGEATGRMRVERAHWMLRPFLRCISDDQDVTTTLPPLTRGRRQRFSGHRAQGVEVPFRPPGIALTPHVACVFADFVGERRCAAAAHDSATGGIPVTARVPHPCGVARSACSLAPLPPGEGNVRAAHGFIGWRVGCQPRGGAGSRKIGALGELGWRRRGNTSEESIARRDRRNLRSPCRHSSDDW